MNCLEITGIFACINLLLFGFIVTICFNLIEKIKNRNSIIKNKELIQNQILELSALYAESIHSIKNDAFKVKEWDLSEKEYFNNIIYVSAYTRTLFYSLKDFKGLLNNEDYVYLINFFGVEFSNFCTYQNQKLNLEKYKDVVEHIKVEKSISDSQILKFEEIK